MQLLLQHIQKIYQDRSIKTTALQDVSLQLYSGEDTVILGASGAGKSSLLSIIGLLDRNFEGQYMIDDTDVSTLSAGKLARLRNELFGFVFQDYMLVETETVFENVRIPLLYSRHPARLHKQMIEEALELVELADVAGKKVTALSGGQHQRVAIARALVHKPTFILADEPTGSLDLKLLERIMELMKRYLNEKHSIIMVTHNETLAAQYFKRQIRLHNGMVLDAAPYK